MNTHVLSPMFYLSDALSNDEVFECEAIVQSFAELEKAQGEFDVVALQEVWTDAGIGCFASGLGALGYHYFAGKLLRDIPNLEEDAGLMILSRLPFEKLENPADQCVFAEQFKNEHGSGVDASYGFAQGIVYENAESPDDLAGKGLLHVQVKKGGIYYDILNTHLQAPEGHSTIRSKQIGEINQYLEAHVVGSLPGRRKQAVIVGDFNINGKYTAFGCDSNQDRCSGMEGSEYDKSLRQSLGDNRNFFDSWLTTAPKEQGVTSPHEGKRLDYVMFYGKNYVSEQGELSTRPLSEKFYYPQYIRTALRAAGSDHAAVAVDIGPSSPHAAPWQARVRSVTRLARTTATLEKAGSNSWYLIPDPGTYSIEMPKHALELGIVADVFSEDDLNQPLQVAPMFEERSVEDESCKCSMVRRTYLGGSRGLYVRVHDPAGRAYGDVPIVIHRHDCSAPEFACEPRAGGKLQEINLENPSSLRRESYFNIRTLEVGAKAYSSYPITLKVEGLGANDYVDFKLVYMAGPTQSEVVGGDELLRVNGERSLEVPGGSFVRVIAYPSRPGLGWKFGWKTDATVITNPQISVRLVNHNGRMSYVSNTSAYCSSESFGIGSDEASLEILADGVRVGYGYHDDLDQGESIGNIMLKQLGFFKQGKFVVKEYNGDASGSVQNYGYKTIDTLSPNIEHLKEQKIKVEADGLHLEVFYGLTHSVLP